MSPAQVYISLYYSQGGRICVTDTDTDTALPPVIARIRRENEWPCRLQALTNSNLDGQGPATELVRDFDRP